MYSLKIRPFLDRCFPCPIPTTTAATAPNEREELAELRRLHQIEAASKNSIINIDIDEPLKKQSTSSVVANKSLMQFPLTTLNSKSSNVPTQRVQTSVRRFNNDLSSSSSSDDNDVPIMNYKDLRAKFQKNKSISSSPIRNPNEVNNFNLPEIKKSPSSQQSENVTNFVPLTTTTSSSPIARDPDSTRYFEIENISANENRRSRRDSRDYNSSRFFAHNYNEGYNDRPTSSRSLMSRGNSQQRLQPLINRQNYSNASINYRDKNLQNGKF